MVGIFLLDFQEYFVLLSDYEVKDLIKDVRESE